MYYTVKNEETKKGEKAFFNVGQKINDSDIQKTKDSLSMYRLTTYDSFNIIKYVWLGKDIFEADYFVHSLSLEKIKSK